MSAGTRTLEHAPSAGRAPGPTGLGAIPWLLRLRKDSLPVLSDAVERFGDIVRFPLPPGGGRSREVVIVRGPDEARRVLKDNHMNYRKSHGYEVLGLALGEGLLTSDGDHWRRQRRLAQPMFHKQRIEGFARTMTSAADEMLHSWDRFGGGARVDVAAEMRNVALTIVGRTLFSEDLGLHADAVSRGLNEGLDFLDKREAQVINLPLGLPTPRNRRFRQALALLDGVVATILESRRGRGPSDDLLSMLMEARDEETGAGMTDKQLRDEIITFFLAGHETTANALAWAWYLLAHNPGERERLEREVDAALGGRMPGMDDLSHLPFTQSVVQESMRLYPPAWMVEREAVQDDVLGGYDMRAGTVVIASPYLTHRHPRIWDEPEAFRPGRFAGGSEAASRSFAYYPFGGGPRQCIGNTFAMVEAQILLAAITQRYRLELEPGQTIEPEAKITLRPRGGRMLMRLERRS